MRTCAGLPPGSSSLSMGKQDWSARWWDSLDHRWCGVFQGGGARGIAYVGALKAFVESGKWFSSVAGASAGAITAALVAGGAKPDELGDLGEALLRRLKPRVPLLDHALAAIHPAVARWNPSGLREELDTWLQSRVSTNHSSVTFADLYLDLYVVALDVVAMSPVVISRHRHPEVPVADAVVASCSLPMVFEPAYSSPFDPIVGLKKDYAAVWRSPLFGRLADGGAWANLPIIVFTDRRLRQEFGLPPLPSKAPIISFCLSDPQPLLPPRHVFAEGHPTLGPRARLMGQLAEVSTPFRKSQRKFRLLENLQRTPPGLSLWQQF